LSGTLALARDRFGSQRITITARTLLVAQAGGPTAVINASLAGVISATRESGAFGRVLGLRHGVEGLLSGQTVDLTHLPGERLARLRQTPSAALGTSRHRPDDGELPLLLDACRAHGAGALVLIGGNDTADTALRLATVARERGDDLRVLTVPKTIDNDLPETDHCPGYGSIARFVALAVRDAAFDTRAMAQLYPIKLVEVMGRNAGWLAAAGTLAFAQQPAMPRPIVCLPERPFGGLAELAEVVQQHIERDGYAVLVVPETMKWANGKSVAGTTPDWVDAFGHRYFPGAGSALARQLTATLGHRARYDKPGTIARMALHAASDVDLMEAFETGVEAVRRAVGGESARMVTIVRTSNAPYRVAYDTTPLERVANIERCVPADMIAYCGYALTEQFTSYALPLTGAPFPPYEVLA
jgi:6-phosphofructokinase